MSISTHVLDLVHGGPARGVWVRLEQKVGKNWQEIQAGHTDSDGRLRDLLPKGVDLAGIFRLSFDTGAWFKQQNRASFYPEVSVVFEIVTATEHYHVPLLLGPYGYSTYRGS
ncbi:MAG TPA: hydroxyisourate hydrolase [Myxococcota bacterium]|nr:hydroxyisourate hydrolase [Myxococcota bacterium]